jgi:hypothetical protein
VAVTTADVTAATTMYAVPYGGNRIALYDGAAWNVRTSAQFSLALGTLTNAAVYDVFCYDNATVPTLEFLQWTNPTTRATALTTQDGVLVKSGAATRRYLGSFYTMSTTTTEDSAQNRMLWNYYNRASRPLQRYESTTNWNYTTATVRQANGSTANQVTVVIGVAEVQVDLFLMVDVFNTNAGVNVSAGIGEDSTTTYVAGGLNQNPVGNTGLTTISCRMTKMPAVGYHYYSWNEFSTATGTTTWYAAVAGIGSNITAGLSGDVWG